MMSRISGRDTKPELVLRKLLHGMGFRYRTHVGTLPGRPDLAFSRRRAVVFVHGCFWHRHGGCKYSTVPASNSGFWEKKFSRNIERDLGAIRGLEEIGWRVGVIWECELEARAPLVAKSVARWLRGKKRRLEIPRHLKAGIEKLPNG
jgi:DNA mismatch endonuclease (patch repair protein)